jgi:hypothetical protein
VNKIYAQVVLVVYLFSKRHLKVHQGDNAFRGVKGGVKNNFKIFYNSY